MNIDAISLLFAILSAGIALGGIIYMFLYNVKKDINFNTSQQIKELSRKLDHQFNETNRRFDRLENRFSSIEEKLFFIACARGYPETREKI